jgi:hypothetical protein
MENKLCSKKHKRKFIYTEKEIEEIKKAIEDEKSSPMHKHYSKWGYD